MTGPASQIAIAQVVLVVKDIEKSMPEYNDTMGWGPWKIYDYHAPRLHDVLVRAVPQELTWLVAETVVGPNYVELLQPLGGASIWRDFLDQQRVGGVS